MKHILATKDLTKDQILSLFAKADEFYPVAKNKGQLNLLNGKILAALFYEPSTRTRLSTETAMLRLGGSVINAVGEENSSLSKGETLYDTAKVVSQYADIVAIRHSRAGSAAEFALGSTVSVVNCGDGANDHPTQALLDAYTIYKQFGRLDNLDIAFVGDIKNSRNSHGLLALLNKFGNSRIRLAAPEVLKLADEYKFSGLEFVETESLEEGIRDADVICSCRVRIEKFEDKSEYERLKAIYVFNRAVLEKCAPKSILLAPLPRVDEILVEVDEWHGAKYFEAVTNGVAVRMAILEELIT